MRKLRNPLGPATALALLAPWAMAPPASAQERPESLATWLAGPEALLLVPAERELLAGVATDAGGRAFIEWFWDRRDPDPSTALNELRQEFRDRLAFVNKEFLDPTHDAGWRTARGIVYLVMGPPRWSGPSSRRLRIDGQSTQLILWEYPPTTASGPVVRFFFAPTPSRTRLIGETTTIPPLLDEALAAARARAIRPDAPPLLGAIALVDAGALEIRGRAEHAAGGALALLEIDLRALTGVPAERGIGYRLRIETVPAGDSQAAGVALGALEFELSLEAMQEWSDHPLQVAAWLPDPGGATARVRVIEEPSGRRASVPVVATPAPPGPQPVAHSVGVSALEGDGAAIAYFATCALRHPVAAGHLVTLAEDAELPAAVLPGGRLALIPAAPTVSDLQR